MLIAAGVMLLTGCAQKKLNYAKTFPKAVEITANQLSRDMGGDRSKKILFTSLVNLNDMSKSSKFGRLFSESLMTQMKLRGYNIVEYRGDAIVTKSKAGEFKLNRGRAVTLKDKEYLILVGTYSKMAKDVVVNIRIVHSWDNLLEAATSVYIPLASSKEKSSKPVIIKTKEKFQAHIVKSHCDSADYCWRDLNE